MPTSQYEQFDFSVGEIAPANITRAGLSIRSRSLQTAKNVKLEVQGAASARAGTTWLADLTGDAVLIDVTIGGDVFYLVFTNAAVAVWSKETRTQVATLTGLPWSSAMLADLAISAHGPQVFVGHADMPIQLIERSSAGTWTAAAFAFASGIGGAIAQPHHRFEASGTTLTPSALTGTIDLTASTAIFTASSALYVGLRYRLQGREVEITGITSGTVATATVIQPLLPTHTVTVTSSAGFEIGEVIEGKDSTAKGEVVGIPSSTTLTVLMQTFTSFYYSGSTGEKVIGRNAVAETTAADSVTTNAAVLDWTEQAISAIRRYPGALAVHRGRLWIGAFENIPFGLAASAINDFTDFEVGTNDDDAIFEELGDQAAGLIRHIVSAEQLIVLTSRNAFYYPESEQNPIKPSSFELLRIGPDGASTCNPTLISEGLLYGQEGGGSILGAFPTGDIRRSWRTADMSRLAAHLINSPRCMAYVSGVAGDSQRLVYAPMSDGTMSVVCYSESDADAVPGWAPWETDGSFKWVAANGGECWAITSRTWNGTTHYCLEVFEASRLVDSARDIEAADSQGAATTQTISTIDGSVPADLVFRCAELPNATLSLIQDGTYIGEVTTDGDGDFGVLDMDGDIEVGFAFDVECVCWPPLPPEDQRARRRKRRMSGILIRYQGKGIQVDGKLRPIYDANDDLTAPAPNRDEWWRWVGFGWSHEPVCTVSRAFPAAWKLLGIALEVAS